MARSKEKKPRSATTNAIELVVTLAVAVGLAVLIQALVVKPYKIPTTSMVPTLEQGQRVLVNRLDTDPALGDIVVFHPPAGADPSPAVCGNAHQGAGFRQACGQPTPRESTQTFIKRVVGLPGDRISIVGGHVIRNGVMEQAPYVQPCPYPQACDFPAPIIVPRGHYFMMGDNRGISDDSRFWGPVLQQWIIGVAVFTYWPPGRIGFL